MKKLIGGDPYHTIYAKIYFKWIKDLNIKSKAVIILEENKKETFATFEWWKVSSTEHKNNELYFIMMF